MKPEERKQIKELSNLVYKITEAFATIGINLSNILLQPANQLAMDIPDATVIKYQFVREHDNNKQFIPTLGSDHAAAYDLRADIWVNPDTPTVLLPGKTLLIPTNLKVEVPIGFELIVTPRSGLAIKGITVANTPGTIDADYRGEVMVILHNQGDSFFEIHTGDRIAQCKLKRVEPTAWVEAPLSETARGEGGFGSTGVK